MDAILNLFSDPTILIIMVVLLFGGNVKIGDKTLLQFVMDLLANILKPTPSPAAAASGTILTTLTGLLSNPMVLIVGMLAFMMLTGGSCKKQSAAIGADIVPAVGRIANPSYSGPPITLTSWELAASDQVPLPPPALDRAGLVCPVYRSDVCQCESCQPARARVVTSAPAARVRFMQRGPVRRFIANRQPLRRVGRALRWVFCR